MEIKLNTRFSPGEEVWMMRSNYPIKVKISGIKIDSQFLRSPSSLVGYTYVVKGVNDNEYTNIMEEYLCKTKEELKQKIFD